MAWDPLLTVEQTAQMLALSEGTVRNWLSEKKLEYVKIGRTTRIRQSVLERFRDQNTVAAAEE